MTRISVALFLLLAFVSPAFGYSLLTHEQLIDLTWDDSIVPLLLSRYPGLTPAQLDEARAYAYGGCVIQDIGYYPFGQALFSNLTHYVRSGDFIINLFRDSTNANELAFAVGALSHYIGDSIGHPVSTNLSVPIEFPKLKAKYGTQVSYAEGEHQHVQVEFAYDIDEIAHHRMAPLKYMKHIGMQVSMPQLEKAYHQTYGLNINFSNTRGHRVNVGAYRFAVRNFIPRIAYAETLLHRRHEVADVDSPEAVELRTEITAMETVNDWDKYRRHAGIGTWSLAGLIFVLPKVGPLKLLAVKGPTAQTEQDYQHSLALSVAAMRQMLARFTPPDKRKAKPVGINVDKNALPSSQELKSSVKARDVSQTRPDPAHPLPNRDLDTGNDVKPGGYRLTDETYASLLHTLTRQPNLPIPPGIKENIQAYYADLNVPFETKKYPAKWDQVLKDLDVLKAMPTSNAPEVFPTYDEGGQ